LALKKVKKELELEQRRLELVIGKQEEAIEEIKNNKIYENAFEWRFEFPEVLNEEGAFVGFDVVIGNPPYISYYSGMASSISKQEYAYYIDAYDFIINKKAKNRLGTVMMFLEKSTKLLRPSGYFSNIIDLNIFSPAFFAIRQYLNRKISVTTIISNIAVFEGVGSGQVVFSYYNNAPINNFIELYNGFKDSIKFPQSYSNLKNSYNFQYNLNNSLIEKIQHNTVSLERSCYLISGMNIGGVKDYFLSESKLDSSYHMAILSGNIFRYEIKYPNEVQFRSSRNYFIRFDKVVEKEIWDRKIGTPSIGADDSKFKKEKLLVRRPLTGDGKLAVAYSDNPDHFSDVTVYIINETLQPLNFLLGILNSKLATWYSRKAGIIRFEKGQQPQITINKLKEFPIAQTDESKKGEVVALVNQILSYKLNTDTSHLESQIDQLVYQLYNLTPEEIKIVEGEV